MWERKTNLTQQFDPPIDNSMDNDIEKDAKEIMKDMIQYRPDDRLAITQVVDMLSLLKDLLVNIGDYEIIVSESHKLGKGSSGVVHEGQHVATQKKVAAKRYITEAKNHNYVACYKNELNMLKNVVKPHANIVDSYHSNTKESEEDGKQIVEFRIVMEMCNLGNLREYAKQRELTVQKKAGSYDPVLQSSPSSP